MNELPDRHIYTSVTHTAAGHKRAHLGGPCSWGPVGNEKSVNNMECEEYFLR